MLRQFWKVLSIKVFTAIQNTLCCAFWFKRKSGSECYLFIFVF